MREDGLITIASEYGNVVEKPTLQCRHCGAHFVVVKGSGRIRGFCLACMGPTCGARKCIAHSPFEKRLDLVELGKLPLKDL
jgi:hypothetical protein